MTKAGGRTKRQKEAYWTGLRAERAAGLYLKLKGYRLLVNRYRSPVGEIDLIAKTRNTIVFIEVKKRQDLSEGLHSLHPKQQARIVRAAEYWLSENELPLNTDCRFDMIVFSAYLLPQHIENAFSIDEAHRA